MCLYIYIYRYIIMIINKYVLDIYIYLIHGKYSATLGFMKFVKILINFMKPKVAEYFPWIKCIYIYI